MPFWPKRIHAISIKSYKRLCRKGAYLTGVCAKQHTDLIPMPTYSVRRTHVQRSAHVRTTFGVRVYAERCTSPSEQKNVGSNGKTRWEKQL